MRLLHFLPTQKLNTTFIDETKRICVVISQCQFLCFLYFSNAIDTLNDKSTPNFLVETVKKKKI